MERITEGMYRNESANNLHIRQQHRRGSFQVTNLISQIKTAKAVSSCHHTVFRTHSCTTPLSTVHTCNDNSLQNSTYALIRQMHQIWMWTVKECKWIWNKSSVYTLGFTAHPIHLTFFWPGLYLNFSTLSMKNVSFEQKMIKLWNKWHFVKNKTEIMHHV
jgi:hypothetical protein